MKAIQINKYGNDEVLEINKKADKPAVSPGHVLIEVHAAGVNPIDWKIREGLMQNMLQLKLPFTLGVDFSGVVKEVGEGVTGFKKEDEVYGQASFFRDGLGSFAEFISAEAKMIALKPKKINHMTAAALPLVGVSAWQALVEIMSLSKDKKVLIHGGSGGIGSIAIQLAKYLGAYVATTVSAENKSFVKSLGADEIVDYKTENFEDILHDFDAVLDTVGGETYIKSFKVLRNEGMIVSLLEQPRQDQAQRYGAMLEHLRQETGHPPKVRATFMFTGVTNERLAKVADLVDKNVIKVNIAKEFPIDQTKEALAYIENEHPRGKVVVEVIVSGKSHKKLNKQIKEKRHA